jgi:hypothetical protein
MIDKEYSQDKHPQAQTVTIHYAVTERVKIKELDRPGVVIGVFMDGSKIQYRVRYFYQGEAKEVYFYDWEIESSGAA